MQQSNDTSPRFHWAKENELQCEGIRLLVAYFFVKPSEERITLLKNRSCAEKYIRELAEFDAKNVLELGIYEGGSMVFFWHLFQLEKLVGVELSDGAPQLENYIEKMSFQDRMKCYFGTSQDDRARLAEIVAEEFGSKPLDIVNDDASHLYHETKASFEFLFPLLRPGGLYFIEDWRAFDYLADHADMSGQKTEVHKLILELVLASMVPEEIIRRITVEPEFVIVERGDAVLDNKTFQLADYMPQSKENALNPADPDGG